jgi:hypothetical protein
MPERRRGRIAHRRFAASAASASAPPSPRLSARSTSSTYFSVTTSIRAQKMADTAPTRLEAFKRHAGGGREDLTSSVYSGLVPMSP